MDIEKLTASGRIWKLAILLALLAFGSGFIIPLLFHRPVHLQQAAGRAPDGKAPDGQAPDGKAPEGRVPNTTAPPPAR